MNHSSLYYSVTFIATLSLLNSGAAWSSAELQGNSKAATSVKTVIAKTLKTKITPQADVVLDGKLENQPVLAGQLTSTQAANPYMTSTGIPPSTVPSFILPLAAVEPSVALSAAIPVKVVMQAPVYNNPTNDSPFTYLGQNHVQGSTETVPQLFTMEDAANFLNGLGVSVKNSLLFLPQLGSSTQSSHAGSSETTTTDLSSSMVRLFSDLKMMLPLTGDSTILPSIKKVYPTGEKPLVVINFKCPTEVIGITPPPMKLLHEAINLGFEGLNKTDLLSFNLQQVCS